MWVTKAVVLFLRSAARSSLLSRISVRAEEFSHLSSIFHLKNHLQLSPSTLESHSWPDNSFPVATCSCLCQITTTYVHYWFDYPWACARSRTRDSLLWSLGQEILAGCHLSKPLCRLSRHRKLSLSYICLNLCYLEHLRKSSSANSYRKSGT